MKFWSFNLGCRVNQAEKEKIDRELIAHGLVMSEDDPDVCIVNTCAVTQKAEKESRQFVRSLKRKYPTTKIAITGCSATKWKKEDHHLNEIDLAVDNLGKNDLSENIIEMFPHESFLEPTSFNKDLFVRSGRTFVKIQDGCDRRCAYCLVPSLRGPSKSRKTADIIDEIKHLDPTIKEVILTAINTETFGKETNESLTQLIKSVLSKTDIARLSFGSIHPWSLNDQLLNYLKDAVSNKKFVNYFHVPIQSGSDKILGLMKRGYKVWDVIEKLNTIRKYNYLSQLGTDILVGFPGETDKDFENTLSLLKKTSINRLHIFRFSLRSDTGAESLVKLYGEIPEEIKKKRAKTLLELGENKMFTFKEKHLNKKFEALFLVKKVNGFQEVLLENQMEAFIEAKRDFASEIKKVEIKSLKDGKLYGKIAQ